MTLRDELERLRTAYEATEDHTLAERDAQEAYFNALYTSDARGHLVTREELDAAVAKEREAIAMELDRRSNDYAVGWTTDKMKGVAVAARTALTNAAAAIRERETTDGK